MKNADRFNCGHERTPNNSYVGSNGYPFCRTCARERQRGYDRAKRAQVKQDKRELAQLREEVPQLRTLVDALVSAVGSVEAIDIAYLDSGHAAIVTSESTSIVAIPTSDDSEAATWLADLLRRSGAGNSEGA